MVRVNIVRKKNCLYSTEQLSKALAECKSGVPAHDVSKRYNIPKQTLYNKIHKKYKKSGTGPATVLSVKEEKKLVQWIDYMCTLRRPIKYSHLINSVELLVKKQKKPNNFVDNRPGRSWQELFFHRHKGLKEKIKANNKLYSSTVNVEEIKEWFVEYKSLLQKEKFQSIFGSRLFNMAEVSLALNHKTIDNRREKVSVIITGNAAGIIGPPMLILNSDEDKNQIKKLPPYYSVGVTKDSRMNSEIFYQYIVKHFYPWLVRDKIKFPVILFLDDQVFYLTQLLTEFCNKHQILLLVLPRHKTHVVQPMDFNLAVNIERQWTRVLNKLKGHEKVILENFGPWLWITIHELNLTRFLRNSFRKCGLYPPSVDNYIRGCVKVCTFSKDNTLEARILQKSSTLLSLEKNIDHSTLNEFRLSANCSNWQGKKENADLFYAWKKILNDHNEVQKNPGKTKSTEAIQTRLSKILGAVENQENERPKRKTISHKYATRRRKANNEISIDENSIILDIKVVDPSDSLQDNDCDSDE